MKFYTLLSTSRKDPQPKERWFPSEAARGEYIIDTPNIKVLAKREIEK